MDALSQKLRPRMRFHPPDDKVVDFFLRAKITGNDDLVDFIPQAQSCKWDPWDLKIWLDSCCIKTTYPEWWFFSPLDLKHRSGNRSNRATNAGYWKVTRKDKKIMSHLELIGKKKFLVFHRGHGKGERTKRVIHEYHTTLKELDGTHPGQNAFVLCRLSYKHGNNIKDPNINYAQPAVSSPTTSKSFLKESESELLLASEFPASELGDFTTTNDDLQIEERIIELQHIVAGDISTPSISLHNNPTVSSATTVKSSIEELESMLGLDPVSPKKYVGGKTSNSTALNNCNQNSYSACTARNEVPEATVNEFEEGLSLSDLPSEPPYCNLSSWSAMDMQCRMSDSVTYELNNGHCGTYFHEKNLTLVSNKDNGSSTGSDAKMANKLFEWCDLQNYNAYPAKNELPEATASEVDLQIEEGLFMSDLLPKPPDCNLSSPSPWICHTACLALPSPMTQTTVIAGWIFGMA